MCCQTHSYDRAAGAVVNGPHPHCSIRGSSDGHFLQGRQGDGEREEREEKEVKPQCNTLTRYTHTHTHTHLLIVVDNTCDFLGVASEGGHYLFRIFLKHDSILIGTSGQST